MADEQLKQVPVLIKNIIGDLDLSKHTVRVAVDDQLSAPYFLSGHRAAPNATEDTAALQKYLDEENPPYIYLLDTDGTLLFTIYEHYIPSDLNTSYIPCVPGTRAENEYFCGWRLAQSWQGNVKTTDTSVVRSCTFAQGEGLSDLLLKAEVATPVYFVATYKNDEWPLATLIAHPYEDLTLGYEGDNRRYEVLFPIIEYFPESNGAAPQNVLIFLNWSGYYPEKDVIIEPQISPDGKYIRWLVDQRVTRIWGKGRCSIVADYGNNVKARGPLQTFSIGKNLNPTRFLNEEQVNDWLAEVFAGAISHIVYLDEHGNELPLTTVNTEDQVWVTTNITYTPGKRVLNVYKTNKAVSKYWVRKKIQQLRDDIAESLLTQQEQIDAAIERIDEVENVNEQQQHSIDTLLWGQTNDSPNTQPTSTSAENYNDNKKSVRQIAKEETARLLINKLGSPTEVDNAIASLVEIFNFFDSNNDYQTSGDAYNSYITDLLNNNSLGDIWGENVVINPENPADGIAIKYQFNTVIKMIQRLREEVGTHEQWEQFLSLTYGTSNNHTLYELITKFTSEFLADVIEVSSSFTLTDEYNGKIIKCTNTNDIIITIPLQSNSFMKNNNHKFECEIVRYGGTQTNAAAGRVHFTGVSGVSIKSIGWGDTSASISTTPIQFGLTNDRMGLVITNAAAVSSDNNSNDNVATVSEISHRYGIATLKHLSIGENVNTWLLAGDLA